MLRYDEFDSKVEATALEPLCRWLGQLHCGADWTRGRRQLLQMEQRNMQIAIASDHAGFALKNDLVAFLRAKGHDVADLGTYDTESVDYPDYSERVARAVVDGQAARGIMVCGSGVGGAVAANKIRGIRAGLCHDVYSARQGVEHDDMNVLVLGGLVIGPLLARELVLAFLDARYDALERHARRLGKIALMEERYRPAG